MADETQPFHFSSTTHSFKLKPDQNKTGEYSDMEEFKI